MSAAALHGLLCAALLATAAACSPAVDEDAGAPAGEEALRPGRDPGPHASAAERADSSAPAPAGETAPDTLSATDEPMVGVLLRTTGSLTEAQRDTLRRMGVRVGSEIGTIVTARVPEERLSEVVSLSFVRYAERAERLHPEPPEPPAEDPSP